MKGDYHRYLAEFATGNDRKEAAENSLVAYKAASDIAMTELPPTHPIRYVIVVSSTRSSKILLNQNLVHLGMKMCRVNPYLSHKDLSE